MLTAVLDAGAEEVNDLGESFEVISEPTDLVTVRTAVSDAGLEYDSAEAAFLPTVEVDLDEEQAKRVFRLIEALEDSDDVQDVYANYSVSDDIMEKLGRPEALRGRIGRRHADPAASPGGRGGQCWAPWPRHAGRPRGRARRWPGSVAPNICSSTVSRGWWPGMVTRCVCWASIPA